MFGLSLFLRFLAVGFASRVGEGLSPEERAKKLRELIIAAQQGDQESYRQFLSLLYKSVSAHCRRSLPNQEIAEDCVQEVLLAIHRNLHTYNPERSIRGWVSAITRNKIVDFYRAWGRRAHESSHTELVEEAATSSSVSRFEAQQGTSALLAQLPEEFVEPLKLVKLQGLSVAEAAERLKIGQSLVKVRIHRGIKKLKEIAQRESFEQV